MAGSSGGSSIAGSSGAGGDGSGGNGSGGNGSGGGGAGGQGSSGSAGSGGAPTEAGAGGSAGEAADAGADAALDDASAASRLGCDPAQQADCGVRAAALTHRYSFADTGSAVLDRVGSAHGTVLNGQLSGSGSVLLTGAASPENYVNLPNGIVSALASATFEAWLSWEGGQPWQRLLP